MEQEIEIGSMWKHYKNGNIYVVTNILNKGNDPEDDNNPPIIAYIKMDKPRWKMWGINRPTFGRLATRWHSSFRHVKARSRWDKPK